MMKPLQLAIAIKVAFYIYLNNMELNILANNHDIYCCSSALNGTELELCMGLVGMMYLITVQYVLST